MDGDFYAQVGRHPNIHGAKEVSGQTGLVLDTLVKCAADSFWVWSGNDEQIVPFLAMGAQGVFSIAANLLPEYIVGMVREMKFGQIARAAARQRNCYHLITRLFAETHPIPVKMALGWRGFEMGELRRPLCALTPEGSSALRKALSDPRLAFSFAE